MQTYAYVITRTYSYTDELPHTREHCPHVVQKFLYPASCKSISTVMGLTKQSDLEHVVLLVAFTISHLALSTEQYYSWMKETFFTFENEKTTSQSFFSSNSSGKYCLEDLKTRYRSVRSTWKRGFLNYNQSATVTVYYARGHSAADYFSLPQIIPMFIGQATICPYALFTPLETTGRMTLQ